MVPVREHRRPHDGCAASLLVHRVSRVVHRCDLGDRTGLQALLAGLAMDELKVLAAFEEATRLARVAKS